jgi:hypothetical protein
MLDCGDHALMNAAGELRDGEGRCVKMAGKTLRVLVLVGLVAVVTIVVKVWFFGTPPSDEEQILLAIADAEASVERGSVGGVTRVLSNEYKDGFGQDKGDVTRLVLAGLRSHQQWQVNTEARGLEVSGDSAEVRLKVTFWPADTAAERLDYEIMSSWRKEGRTWRVVSSSGWQGMTEEDVMNVAPAQRY